MMGLQAGMIISLVIILMHNGGQLGVQAAALQQHLDGKYFSGAPKSDAAIKISENTNSRKDHEIKIYMKGKGSNANIVTPCLDKEGIC